MFIFPFPHARTMRPRYPLAGLSALHGSRVRTGVSYFIQRGTYPFRQEGKQKTTGSRWIQSLVEKGEMTFFSFFLCLVFSLRDQREKRRMGASVQGIRGTVVFFSFPLRLFFGSEAPKPSPWGTRGIRGMNDSEYLFGVSVSHTCVSVSIYK